MRARSRHDLVVQGFEAITVLERDGPGRSVNSRRCPTDRDITAPARTVAQLAHRGERTAGDAAKRLAQRRRPQFALCDRLAARARSTHRVAVPQRTQLADGTEAGQLPEQTVDDRRAAPAPPRDVHDPEAFVAAA